MALFPARARPRRRSARSAEREPEPTRPFNSLRLALNGRIAPVVREDKMTYQGECFCGAVRIEANGAPEAMGYCHCRSCRSWSGGPVNAFSLWRPEDVRVVVGADNLA